MLWLYLFGGLATVAALTKKTITDAPAPTFSREEIEAMARATEEAPQQYATSASAPQAFAVPVYYLAPEDNEDAAGEPLGDETEGNDARDAAPDAVSAPHRVVARLHQLDKKYHWLSLMGGSDKNGTFTADPRGGHFEGEVTSRRSLCAAFTMRALLYGEDAGREHGTPILDDITGELTPEWSLLVASFSITTAEINALAARDAAYRAAPSFGEKLLGAFVGLLFGLGGAVLGGASKVFGSWIDSDQPALDAALDATGKATKNAALGSVGGFVAAFGGSYRQTDQGVARRVLTPEEQRVVKWMTKTLCPAPRLDERALQLWTGPTTDPTRRISQYLTTVAHALSGDIPLQTALERFGGLRGLEAALVVGTVDGEPVLNPVHWRQYDTPGALVLRCALLARGAAGLLSPQLQRGPAAINEQAFAWKTHAKLMHLSFLFDDAEPTISWLTEASARLNSLDPYPYPETMRRVLGAGGLLEDQATVDFAPDAFDRIIPGGTLGFISPQGQDWIEPASLTLPETRRFLPSVYLAR